MNKLFFRWYYKRVPGHFHQWKFKKSVKQLIQNYEHHGLLLKNAHEHNRNLTKDNDKMRKILSDIRFKEIASEDQINIINGMFGLDIHNDQEN